jgi:hypothetical protein
MFTKLDDRYRFHSETGPAFRFHDGYQEYYLHNFKVDERLVMNPGSITLEEINLEKNAEMKRLLIDRYGGGILNGGGIGKYLWDSKAKTIDWDTHTHNGTRGVIAVGEGDVEQRYLNVADPSSSRVYYMEVPPDKVTPEEAAYWLDGEMDVKQVGRT